MRGVFSMDANYSKDFKTVQLKCTFDEVRFESNETIKVTLKWFKKNIKIIKSLEKKPIKHKYLMLHATYST